MCIRDRDKAVLTGTPIRQELLEGNPEKALEFTGLSKDKPVILIIGGSLGAAAVNDAVRKILPELLKDFQVIHLCGKDKVDETLSNVKGYVQYEYIKQELADLFALADLVISRAGANAICELSALNKPNLLIPLSARASRGDQILNARSFEQLGYSKVLEEEELTNDVLLSACLLYTSMGKSEENEKKCETFFTKNLNDEELNQKILEEFLKEAEEIEKEAEEISKSLECEPTEDGFQKLMAEIRRRESTEDINNYVTNVDDREKHTSKLKELKNVKQHVDKSKSKQGNTCLLYTSIEVRE